MAKKLTIALVVLLLVGVLALTVISCNDSGSSGDSGKKEILPTLTKVKIIPSVNGHNGDEESDVCLEVMSGVPEMFDIEITISNPDNLKILSLNYNGKTFTSDKFSAESTNRVVYIKNNHATLTPENQTVTIDDIKYENKTGSQAKVSIPAGTNVKTIRIQPTFKLTADISDANLTDESTTTINADNTFMARLNLPLDADMNAYITTNPLLPVYGYYGYIFAGWYTEPQGKGTRIDADSMYTFYKDMTLYAYYARAFTYEIYDDECVITGITEHGKTTEFNIEIPNEIDGVPVRRIQKNAFTGVCGGKTVILPNSIKEIGDYAFMNCEGIQIELGTTEIIGKMAFANCGKMVLGSASKYSSTRIGALPTTLRSIGDYAFKGCNWDSSLLNPHREMYFKPQNTLVIPQTVTSIGQYAFTESLFEQVYFEDALSLQSLGQSTFEGSKKLTSIYTGFKFNATGANYTTNTTSGLKDISNRMFYGCTNLVSSMVSNGVKLNDGLLTIGDLAFASSGDGMTGLEYISFPKSLESIGTQAFANTGLKNVIFSTESRLKSLGEYAFENSKFEEITIYSLNTYGNAPFWGNTALKAINILTPNVPKYTETESIWGSGLTRKAKYYVKKELLESFRTNASWTADGASDYVCAYDFITSSNMTGVTLCFEPIDESGNIDLTSTRARVTSVFDTTREITIPSTFTFDGVNYNIVSVGKYFIHDDVTKVYLPSTLERIEDRAFYTCDTLYEVVWRDGTNPIAKGKNKDIALTYIGQDAFNGTAITYFYSNTALTTIGKQAFHNCKNLSTVVLEYGTGLTIMGSSFSQSGLKTLVIGHNVKSIYDSAFQNNKELSLVLINLVELPMSTENNYPSISPFRDCSGLNKILLFSNNAMTNFKSNTTPNGKNNTYADIKKADGITSAYEKYNGSWAEAIEYYHIY